MTEISVLDLPWPDNPFRCGLAAEFHAALPERLPREEVQEAFSQFVEAHTLEGLARCPYHAAYVKQANELAVRALRTNTEIEHLAEAEPPDVFQLARSYFREPITWNRKSPQLTDGPHRACALKMSGAASCVIREIV